VLNIGRFLSFLISMQNTTLHNLIYVHTIFIPATDLSLSLCSDPLSYLVLHVALSLVKQFYFILFYFFFFFTYPQNKRIRNTNKEFKIMTVNLLDMIHSRGTKF
jgi:hypothetical protein